MTRIITLRPLGSVVFNDNNAWKNYAGATLSAGDLPNLGLPRTPTSLYYTRHTASTADDLKVTLDTYTLTPNEIARRLRFRVKQRHGTGYLSFWGWVDGAALYPLTLVQVGANPNIAVERSSAWYAPWGSSSINQADIDSLEVQVFAGQAGVTYDVFDMLADVEIQTSPSVGNVTPQTFANGRTSPTPTFTWVAGDANDLQQRFRLKIFTKAVAEGGGFDFNTSTSVYDSGDVNSANKTHTLPASSVLSLGTDYYVFVRVTNAGGPLGTGWTGDPLSAEFATHEAITITITSPTGTYTTTASPPLLWGYSDPNGDEPGGWIARWFTDAVATAPGFNPWTSNDYLNQELGTVDPGDTPIIPPPMPNATPLRVYVIQASKNYGVVGQDDSTFDLNLTRPPAPSLTAAPVPAEGSIELTMAGQANMLVPEMAEGQSGEQHFDPSGVGTTTALVDLGADGWVHRVTVDTTIANASTYQLPDDTLTPAEAGGVYSWAWQVRKVAGPSTAIGTRMAMYGWTGSANTAALSLGNNVAMTNGGAWTWIGGIGVAPVGTQSLRARFLVSAGAQVGDVWEIRRGIVLPGVWSVAALGAAWHQGFGPLTYDLCRQQDDGTWQMVWSGTDQQHAIVIKDHLPPLNKNVVYRAVAVTRAAGVEVESLPTDIIESVESGYVFLKHPDQPLLNMRLTVQGSYLPVRKFRARTMHKALGAEKPMVVRGDGKYDSTTVSVLLLGEAKYEAFMALIDAADTLVLQTSKATRYVDLSGDPDVQERLWDELRGEPEGGVWQATIPLVEVQP